MPLSAAAGSMRAALDRILARGTVTSKRKLISEISVTSAHGMSSDDGSALSVSLPRRSLRPAGCTFPAGRLRLSRGGGPHDGRTVSGCLRQVGGPCGFAESE